MLIDEIQAMLEKDNIDFLYGQALGAELIEEEIIDIGRWEVTNRAVLRRGDEFVAVEYQTGATEYQDAELNGEAYSVKPVQVTVTQYVRS